MKFFKHFTDAQRGSSLQILKQKHGMAGIGRYWTLVELCAEKLRKEDEEQFTEDHCKFSFGKSYLAECLAYGNHAHLMRYLGDLQVIGLCSVDATEVQVMCSMPKLLECMDRDTKRARTERGRGAPKNKNKEEDKDLESWKIQADQFFIAATMHSSDFKAIEYIGAAWTPYLEAIGGMKFIRSLKNNDFEVKRVARLLKAYWESQKTNQESA